MVFNLIKMCPVYAPEKEILSKTAYISPCTPNRFGKLFHIPYPQKSDYIDLLYICRNVTEVINKHSLNDEVTLGNLLVHPPQKKG
jgi:hypothetical protein